MSVSKFTLSLPSSHRCHLCVAKLFSRPTRCQQTPALLIRTMHSRGICRSQWTDVVSLPNYGYFCRGRLFPPVTRLHSSVSWLMESMRSRLTVCDSWRTLNNCLPLYLLLCIIGVLLLSTRFPLLPFFECLCAHERAGCVQTCMFSRNGSGRLHVWADALSVREYIKQKQIVAGRNVITERSYLLAVLWCFTNDVIPKIMWHRSWGNIWFVHAHANALSLIYAAQSRPSYEHIRLCEDFFPGVLIQRLKSERLHSPKILWVMNVLLANMNLWAEAKWNWNMEILQSLFLIRKRVCVWFRVEVIRLPEVGANSSSNNETSPVLISYLSSSSGSGGSLCLIASLKSHKAVWHSQDANPSQLGHFWWGEKPLGEESCNGCKGGGKK